MRFPPLLAALLGCAMALGATSDLGAKTPKKKIARCVKYTQTKGKDEQSVDVGLRNRCRYSVSCTVEWKISCEAEPDVAPREHAMTVELDRGAREIINASAASCGESSWGVDDIRWTCEPQ